jgi:hypothetical protein
LRIDTGSQPENEERHMGDVYTVVISAILLFPWSLVGVILGGAFVSRARAAAKAWRREIRRRQEEARPRRAACC